MTPKDREKSVEEVTRRLDVIIYLLLDQKKQQGKSNRDIIKELSEFGLKDSEIAKMLGRSRSYVASELTQIRKLAKSKGKKRAKPTGDKGNEG